AKLSNLLVLPRFCLENYLIVPDELWAAFPTTRQDRITGGLAQLRTELLVEKDKWIRHGVLWSVINPLWSGLRALGFKEALLDVTVAQDDNEIKRTLDEWHDYLEPQNIFDEFQRRLANVRQKSEFEQLSLWVHGKNFFRSHVHQVLNRLLDQSSIQDRRMNIFKALEPNDLEPVWGKMGLTQ
ncbi:MAG: hypothetical protein U9R15_11570, partial [Chloroflexota bacterium]|nr:hypothetical protein [Chloroflexota bacterium]